MDDSHELRGQHSIIINSSIGARTVVWNYANIFNSDIGSNCTIGSHTEIGNAKIGDRCKIEAFVFIPKGVVIKNDVFVGPRVTFTNDKYPVAVGEWKLSETVIEDNVSIGANSTILPGITIGKNSIIGAGSVVTKDVESGFVYMGNPARKFCSIEDFKSKKEQL